MTIETIALQQIKDALEKVGDPWEAGVTSLSVVLPDEQQLRLGVKPPPGVSSRCARQASGFSSSAFGKVIVASKCSTVPSAPDWICCRSLVISGWKRRL